MCGIALIRFRKPFSYYVEKYGTYKYGLQKMYLLMQKQHNRGQDGAGIVNVKVNIPPGKRYLSRYRSTAHQPIEDLFKRIEEKMTPVLANVKSKDPEIIKQNNAFLGEVYLGHLRYGTFGGNSLEYCHPFLRQNNWRSRNLILAGNFNLTNVDELFEKLVDLGQHPKDKVDTLLMLEKIGHFLDDENQRIFDEHKDHYTNREITFILEEKIDLRRILERSAKDFEGGYAIAGITGYGACFVARDPVGIRPAYYYANEEIIVAASEKPAIKTAFNIEFSEIKEIQPGQALIIDKDGNYSEQTFIKAKEKRSCSFERIYFSRGTDPEIYAERKKLGELLCPQILEAIHYDLENTVFSYIPNTSETAFLGMMKGIEKYLIRYRIQMIMGDETEKEANQPLSPDQLEKILSFRPRVEKIAIKDAKLRTFITDDDHRDELVSHVYDTTYEVIKKNKDTLVVIDDSIVRGTTLEKSILKMLDRLQPKKIIIVSSAPQIRFPDCYGIDMSKMGDFITFRAVKALLEEKGRENLIEEVYEKCVCALEENLPDMPNYVKELYAPFSDTDISHKIAELVSKDIQAEVEIIFQTVENLHLACPGHTGDWYFTGNYPTQGGNKVVNKALVNFMKGSLERAY